MSTIPIDKSFSSTLELLKDGYAFIAKRCRRYNTDIFKTTLLFMPVICLSGTEAAGIFYDTGKFTRTGNRTGKRRNHFLVESSLHALDGTPDRDSTELFTAVMSPESIDRIGQLVASYLRDSVKGWEQADKVVLFNEMHEMMCRVACAWAGVPLQENEVRLRAKDFGAMVDGSGGFGLGQWRNKQAGKREEAWLAEMISDVRLCRLVVKNRMPLQVLAFQRKPNGLYLDAPLAAAELINLMRPVVAVATYITFAALAMHQHPHVLQKLKCGNEKYIGQFVQEVRRFYPFAPVLSARVRNEFVWRGYQFKKGTLVFFDVYGTNHNPALWKDPEAFKPERFAGWKGSRDHFVLPGCGTYTGNCQAIERVTMEAITTAVRFLSRSISYELTPRQDIRLGLTGRPALPRSGIVIRKVAVV